MAVLYIWVWNNIWDHYRTFFSKTILAITYRVLYLLLIIRYILYQFFLLVTTLS